MTVGELMDTIRGHVRAGLPGQVWVEGEIADLTRARSGHVYFVLAGDDPPARLRVMLRSSHRTRVNRLLTRSGSAVRMVDGTRVRIRGLVDVYGPQSQVQLQMQSIDPEFTLGQLAAARTELLARLAAEGVVDRNAGLPFPPAPTRIAVVTSAAGDAVADVARTLDQSGYRFDVTVFDVPVQGEFAPAAIAAGLDAVTGVDHDVVLLVRGGGASSDLAAFDDEQVARAIGRCAVPVVTGIGHELDDAVADVVAAVRARTPTGAAQILVDRVAGAWSSVAATAAAVAAAARRRMRDERTAHDLRRARLGAATTRPITAQQRHLDAVGSRIVHGAERRLGRAASTLDRSAADLVTASRRSLAAATHRLDLIEARIAANDPAMLVRRGWSITTDGDGAIVRSIADVAPGTRLRTRLADGTVASDVVGTEPSSVGDQS